MSQVSPQREKPGLLLRMIQLLAPRITPLYLRLYRLLGGRLVGGGSVLLITTVGRCSGQPRTVIVGYRRHGDDVIAVGSNFAKPAVPSWVLNLRAHPDAEVQLGRERYQARAEFLEGEIGRAIGTGWWLPSQSTARCSESPAERSPSSGCAGLRGRPSSHPRTPKASAWQRFSSGAALVCPFGSVPR